MPASRSVGKRFPHRWARTWITLAVFAAVLPLHAQEPQGGYILDNFNASGVNTYVWGVYSGLSWYNARLTNAGSETLFCPPDIDMTKEELFRIMSAYGSRSDNAKQRTAPLGLFMLLAVQAAYPCPVAR